MKKILAVLTATLLLLSGVAFGEETPAAPQQEVTVETPAPAPAPQEPKKEETKAEEPKKEETNVEEPAPEGEHTPVETATQEPETITSEPTPAVNVEGEETPAPQETPDATEEPMPTEEQATETISPEETLAPRYIVRFLDWNDEEIDKLDLAQGDAIEEPEEEPVREGWVFSHWYLVSDEKQEAVEFNLTAEGDILAIDLKAMYVEQEIVDIEDEETPLAGPAPEIEVLFSVDGELTYGKTVYLTGNLIGFEGLEYTLQWQYDDGAGWTDVTGATGTTHSFVISSSNEGWHWRLSATIL